MGTPDDLPADIPADTDPAARLASFVDVWWAAVNDFLAFADELEEQAWTSPTDLPGWTARDVLAHLVHLESVAAGVEHPDVEIGDAPHVRGEFNRFCEQGVVALRSSAPSELIARLREITTQRHDDLTAHPPSDPEASAPTVFGLIGWNLETFLGNRPLDVWMHDQDIRRAVGRGGGIDGIPAAYVARKLLGSVPFALGKRVAPPVGTTVVLTVGALPPLAARIGDDGRGAIVAPEEASTADARITTDLEAFTIAAGGRRPPDPTRWQIEGDGALADRLIAALAVTP